jgi:hypothetical protein
MAAAKVAGRGWAYTGAILGGAVSIAANVAHSYVPPADVADPAAWTPHAGAVVGAVFWPLALFVAVEIFARTPWAREAKWAALRWLGLLPVAVVAAVVSYRHLSGLLAFYREDALTVAIGPLAVDGLMVMATGALIATGVRRAVADTVVTEATRTAVQPSPAPDIDTDADTPPASVADMKPARVQAKRRPASADKVAKAAARMPGATVAAIAAKAGVSESTARRYLPVPDATVASPTPPPAAEMPTLRAA